MLCVPNDMHFMLFFGSNLLLVPVQSSNIIMSKIACDAGIL